MTPANKGFPVLRDGRLSELKKGTPFPSFFNEDGNIEKNSAYDKVKKH